jgi:hypothetical protein
VARELQPDDDHMSRTRRTRTTVRIHALRTLSLAELDDISGAATTRENIATALQALSMALYLGGYSPSPGARITQLQPELAPITDAYVAGSI